MTANIKCDCGKLKGTAIVQVLGGLRHFSPMLGYKDISGEFYIGSGSDKHLLFCVACGKAALANEGWE